MDPNTINQLILPAVLGGVGGLTRGFIGLLKALSLRMRILWGYYIITVFSVLDKYCFYKLIKKNF